MLNLCYIVCKMYCEIPHFHVYNAQLFTPKTEVCCSADYTYDNFWQPWGKQGLILQFH